MSQFLGAGECKQCNRAAWVCRCYKDPKIPFKKKNEVIPSEDVTKTCGTCKTPTDNLTRRFVNGRWYHPGCHIMALVPEVDVNTPLPVRVLGGPIPVSSGPELPQVVQPQGAWFEDSYDEG